MSVIGIAGLKRSIPATIYFKIIPVNDQMPFVINNTGLTMWEGGLATITNLMLSEYNYFVLDNFLKRILI